MAERGPRACGWPDRAAAAAAAGGYSRRRAANGAKGGDGTKALRWQSAKDGFCCGLGVWIAKASNRGGLASLFEARVPDEQRGGAANFRCVVIARAAIKGGAAPRPPRWIGGAAVTETDGVFWKQAPCPWQRAKWLAVPPAGISAGGRLAWRCTARRAAGPRGGGHAQCGGRAAQRGGAHCGGAYCTHWPPAAAAAAACCCCCGPGCIGCSCAPPAPAGRYTKPCCCWPPAPPG